MSSASALVEPSSFELPPELLRGVRVNASEDQSTRRLLQATSILKQGKLHSFCPILPLILTLKGEPFTLQRTIRRRGDQDIIVCEGYAPFEPFYRTRMVRKTLYKTGRQVAKSSSIAARSILQCASIPFFSTLFIGPQYETIRRLSQNYVGPFIEQSPVRSLFLGKSAAHSVLQRTFKNNSKMIFSFAFLSADRTRGISADQLLVDECQELAKEHIPILLETMSGSRWKGIEAYAGTPKSLENTIEMLWSGRYGSSMAEWVVKCHRCGYWNVPAKKHDLEAMIGPWREDISYEKPATLCAKCRRYIWPHTGRWVHGREDRRWGFAGYHIPQIIMPMHYADREAWRKLLGKMEGAGNTPKHVFMNEVCGESEDTGSRVVTLTELQKACVLPWECGLTAAEQAFNRDDYTHTVLACDWGGGGEDGLSYTVFAVLGLRGDGKIDVIFGYRSLTPHDHIREAKLAIAIANRFKCQTIAHDYTGAGSLRETLINQSGFPADRILPVAYVRAGAAAKVMIYKPATKNAPRPYYQVDKARSLLLTCNQIRNGYLRFFKWDGDDGLVYDFLGLVDETIESHTGGRNVFTITRDPNMADDFAQAVNIGCCSLWHMSDKWPNIALVANMRVSQDLLNKLHPQNFDPLTELG